jgi:hypothetical protein
MHPAWKPRGPEWATLAPGVKWLIRPLTGEVQAVVSARVARAVGSLQEGRGVLEEAGFEAEDLGQLADLDVLAGLSVFLGAAYLADLLVEAWHGIEDPDTGEEVELTPVAIRAALRLGAPGGGSALMEPFLAYVQRPQQPIAAESRRLRELAKWEHLGGGEHCRGCEAVSAECALGGTDDGDRCPRAINAPQTPAGIAALAATRTAGVWRREGMSGRLVGLDYATCLTLIDATAADTAEWLDRAAAVRFLQAIEAGAIEATIEKAQPES